MNGTKSFYVVVLDGDEKEKSWDYVVSMSEMVIAINYSSSDRQSLSKEEYKGELTDVIAELTNIKTGDKAKGKIYKLTKIQEG